MKHANRNFALAYIALVGLPVLGLAGVLRGGRNLKAPMSVGGVWKVQANAEGLADFPCGRLLFSGNPAFTIAQSGRNFTLNFSNSPFAAESGTVDGTTIRATFVPSGAALKDSGCGAGRTLSLTATADVKATAKTLAGVLRVNDCTGCAPLEFQAAREDQAKGGR